MKKVFPRTLPVLAGYVFLGIAFGVAMKAKGFGLGWSALSSVLIFGGSMQFAMIDPLTQAFAPLTIAFLTLLVQARHLFYGISMLEEYNSLDRGKMYLAFSLTDETYSLVCNGAPAGFDRERWYTAVSLLDHSYWVIGTILGALLGEILPSDTLLGIDFSMTALFAVIVTEQSMNAWSQYRCGKMRLPDVLFPPLLGGCTTLFSLLVIGRQDFLLLSMSLMMTGFLLRYMMEKGRRKA